MIWQSLVDDVAVHSDQWKSHIGDLKKFLEVIKQNGITLNIKKCKCAQNQVRFCGKIGSGKILPDPDKLSVLECMSSPKTKREVRRIVGFFGYFRDHIPNFAEIAFPLTDLTAKRVQKTIPWGEPQQTAFDNLKIALKKATENPQYSVDFSKPFHLFTDASNCAVSGVLTHVRSQSINPT